MYLYMYHSAIELYIFSSTIVHSGTVYYLITFLIHQSHSFVLRYNLNHDLSHSTQLYGLTLILTVNPYFHAMRTVISLLLLYYDI